MATPLLLAVPALVDTLVADVEADGLLDTITKIHCLGIADPRDKTDTVIVYADHPGYPPLREGYARLKTAGRVVFHHGLGYDFFAINRMAPGTLRFEQVYDSLVVSRLTDPESKAHSIEDWGRRLGHPKVEHDDWTTFTPDMAHRCAEDVRINVKVFKKVWAKSRGWGESVALEHQVRLPISLQEQNGFLLDVVAAHALEAELRGEQHDIERELQVVFPPLMVGKHGVRTTYLYPWFDDMSRAIFTPKTGNHLGKGPYVKGCSFSRVELQEFNPGSRHHIEARLRQVGWKPREFTDSGAAKLDDQTMQDLAVTVPVAKPLARFFRIQKQLGQLADGDSAWLKKMDACHRVHGAVNPNGAVTGRMTHFSPNLANVDKKDLRMRAVWIPRVGWVLVGADAEGLELRMLGHFLAPFDGGAFARAVVEGKKGDGTDPHSINMRLLKCFDRDRGPKRFIYAMIYGAGNPKLGLILVEDAVDSGNYTPEKAPHLFKVGKRGKAVPRSMAEIGKEGRVALEKGITGLDKLLEVVKRKHRTQGWIKGLDGRRIYTRSEHSALNTLLQGGGAIVMKKALAIFHFDLMVKAGLVGPDFVTLKDFNYCVNVHDEVQLETLPEIGKRIGLLFADAIRLAGEHFNLRCPLAGSSDVGKNWKDTH